MSDQSSRWERSPATAGEEKPRFQARQNTQDHLKAPPEEGEEEEAVPREAPPIVHWMWLLGVLSLVGLAVLLARMVFTA